MIGGVLVLDFGSQYSHLIVRRCREINVYASMKSCLSSVDEIRADAPKGIILSGGPSSVYEDNAPHLAKGFWQYIESNKIPVLGICYGMQEMIYTMGGKIAESDKREYGSADLLIKRPSNNDGDELFVGISTNPMKVWMSHGDCVKTPAPGFQTIALTENAEYAAVSFPERQLWGLQFHPEVAHTPEGCQLLLNFAVTICGILPNWTMGRFAAAEVDEIKQKVGDSPILGALSGGVDSTVAAALVHRAVGCQFHGVLVDTGMLRKQEADEVLENLRCQGLQVTVVHAKERFLAKLSNIDDPEEKRKIIGHQFVSEFQEVAKTLKLPSNSFLLQGTLYPDVIESKSFRGPSHVIKTHHNVGALPEKLHFRIIEPLRELFKDEVRALGEELGLLRHTVWRHPFPGPGLAIRIIGAVTPERISILQHADSILIEEIRLSGDYEKIGQAFVVLLPGVRTVGVMGDRRTYDMTAVIRAVSTTDYMTADWYKLDYTVLGKCSSRIVNEVEGINRVCYDVTSKPPGTIEWE